MAMEHVTAGNVPVKKDGWERIAIAQPTLILASRQKTMKSVRDKERAFVVSNPY